MGFFSKPEGAQVALGPLSKERVKAAIEAKGWNYGVDEDGDIGAGWDQGSFWFLPVGERGEILRIQGNWRGTPRAEDMPRVLEAINEWNSQKFWPRVYANVKEDGSVAVCTDVIVDWEHGVSDEHLALQLETALGTSHQVFARLAEVFPEYAPQVSED